MSKFAKANKFQKCIFSVILGLRADKEDLKRLKAVFETIDKDMDGSLSYKEIEAAEKTLKGELKIQGKWKDIMKQCDLDGDGKIDFHEFFTAAVNHQKAMTDENLSYAFNMFDTNGDGSIDIEEFRNALPSAARMQSKNNSYTSQSTASTDRDD